MNARFRATPYKCKFDKPIVTSHGLYEQREGVIVRLFDDGGGDGLGDAAPLPGFSADTPADLARGLDTLIAGIRTEEIDYFARLIESTDNQPSLIFALGTAVESMAAQSRGLSLSRWLTGDAAESVPVNGLISGAGLSEVTREVTTLWDQGFRVFKVKVGTGTVKQDIERIMAVVDAAPHAKLRLDANAGWTSQEAKHVLNSIPIASIDFLEQPLAVGMLKESWQICGQYGVRLALDEDASSVETVQAIIEKRACDVLVLKPMIIGSLRASYLLAQAAVARKMDVIYTSSWESDIGVAATLHLAAALGPNPLAMGLSTAGMIASGIVKNPLKIENGHLKVPEGPGLGMELAPEFLAKLQ